MRGWNSTRIFRNVVKLRNFLYSPHRNESKGVSGGTSFLLVSSEITFTSITGEGGRLQPLEYSFTKVTLHIFFQGWELALSLVSLRSCCYERRDRIALYLKSDRSDCSSHFLQKE